MLLDHDDSYWNTRWRLGIPHLEKSSSLQISWTFARFSMWLSPTRLCLVGGIPTPLKNMASSVGVTIPNVWKIIKLYKFMFQTTKQLSIQTCRRFIAPWTSPISPMDWFLRRPRWKPSFLPPKWSCFLVFVPLQRRKNKRNFTHISPYPLVI